MKNIKYSRLSTDGNGIEDFSADPSLLGSSKICGTISCILITCCVFLSIAIAKLVAENRFLQSQYTNYTSSYSFGVISDIQLDLNSTQCCAYETDYSCLCCPNTPALLNATFASFVTVLKMYVNTKFILYLGNIASDEDNTLQTYSYFSDFIEKSEVNIPVYPTLGINDGPSKGQSYENFYSEIYTSWINLISCFDCPLAPSAQGVRSSVRDGGYYTITTTYGVRIISVNTNQFLRTATASEKSGAETQLAWLESVFIEARNVHKTKAKILIGGTAPGYSTKDILVRKVQADTPVTGEWDPILQEKFTALIKKYQFRWAAILMGGVEYELVRLLDHQYIFLTPPCSPIYCSDPAFRVAFLSEIDLQLLDLHQYYSPIEFFTRVDQAPKYMFDFSYERIVFGSNQPRGPVYLNTYSISVLYNSLVSSFSFPHWESLIFTKKIDKRGGYSSPLVTYCTTQHSNQSRQIDCLRHYKYDI